MLANNGRLLDNGSIIDSGTLTNNNRIGDEIFSLQNHGLITVHNAFRNRSTASGYSGLKDANHNGSTVMTPEKLADQEVNRVFENGDDTAAVRAQQQSN